MAEHASRQSRGSAAPSMARDGTFTPGKRTQVEELQASSAPVQRRVNGPAQGDVHTAAARGTQTPATSLPFVDQIQTLFGPRHDVTGIKAHVGGAATDAAAGMGAAAYATGNHAVFAGAPDLHTAAHEAAHVIQQRAGVQLAGGVGDAGDRYERHADQVADRVVRGESAAEVLDTMSGPAAQAPGGGMVQHKREFSEDIDETTQGLIQRVLLADPVLMAMWQWIKQHDTILLEVVKSDQFAAVVAPLGATTIYLKLHPDKAKQNGGAQFLGTLSHELTLHMLPWARLTMMDELMTTQKDEAGLISTVLRPIAKNEHVLKRELVADAKNKETTSFGGNHSDVSLWTSHLRTVMAIARQEEDDDQGTLVVTTAIQQMMLPMLLTGQVEDTIDRGGRSFDDFDTVLDEVEELKSKIKDQETKSRFVSNIARLHEQCQLYREHAFPKSFEDWMKQVNAMFVAEYEASAEDFPDQDYMAAFEDKIPPDVFYADNLANYKAF